MVDKLLCEKVLWEYQVSAVVVGTGAGVDICTCTGAEIDDTTITTNLVIYTWRSATKQWLLCNYISCQTFWKKYCDA